VAAAAQTDDAPTAQTTLTETRRRLAITAVHAVAGKTHTNGNAATVAFRATLTLRGLGDWSYDGKLGLVRIGRTWRVHWQPPDVHPLLGVGQHLARTRSLPPRAALLDHAGMPLFTDQQIVVVTVDPPRFSGGAAELHKLASAVHVDPVALGKRVKAAGRTGVEVIRLRRSDYNKVKSAIHDLPGVVFPIVTARVAPTREFGRQVLGTVGPATAEVLAAAGPAYAPGDVLGLGGLQAEYQGRLAGTPTGSVTVDDAAGNVVTTLQTFTGRAGVPVRTSLDRRVQQAAESALDAAHVNAGALVAIRPSDGAVLAVANRPVDSSLDRALAGRYPPGSTFKVVTTYGLLGAGVTPGTSVPCPPTITVGGRTFSNFEGEHSGHATFADDFALSCNTAFISLANKSSNTAFSDAAAAFGLDGSWTLPAPVFTGSIPVPSSAVDRVAMAIGQGRDLVSPLDLALVAGAVRSGAWRPPVLVTDPTQPSTAASPASLDPSRLATLRALMTSVVRTGTAAGAGLPSGTSGKTGTAEFGPGPTPKTHAWFIGYRGDLAFAVLVEGGGVGGRVAAPVAARFLTGL
jgi:cell division protein FtsI/penicillin-binding protein 2